MTAGRGAIALATLVGFVAGIVVLSALRFGADERVGSVVLEPTTESTSTQPLATVPPGTVLPTTVPLATVTTPAPESPPDVLLAWTSGGLAAGFGEGVAALPDADSVSVVRGDEIGLVAVWQGDGTPIEVHSDGWQIPIDVLALEPTAHGAFVAPADAAALGALGPGEALLSESGARLRRGGVGTSLEFTTGTVEVIGVLSDHAASGAEVVVDTATGDALGVRAERFVLVAHDGDRTALQDAIRGVLDALGAATPVRLRSPAETTWLRHGDAVLPLAQVKLQYGEFAVRDGAGRAVEIDPAWVGENIVEAELPIVGVVRCHRAIIDPLASALGELVDRALTQLVDPGDFAGCHAPRRIGAGLPMSRHAWGIALDLNVADNPRGSFTTQDPRLVDAMRSAGFGWGGSWLVPDPAHYEIVEPT